MNTKPTDLVPIGKASALFPNNPCVATIRAWITVGAGGRRLASYRIGRRLYISVKDAESFVVRQSECVGAGAH